MKERKYKERDLMILIFTFIVVKVCERAKLEFLVWQLQMNKKGLLMKKCFQVVMMKKGWELAVIYIR
jgi:hypothetical protein